MKSSADSTLPLMQFGLLKSTSTRRLAIVPGCSAMLFFLLVCCGGCGRLASTENSIVDSSVANIDASVYQLVHEPEGALGVIDARETAQDGVPIVLVGRVGGAANPWIDGRAAFTLLDASMSVVMEGETTGNGEVCLGDCCAQERTHCTTLVKVVDGEGRLVPVDSRKLLGLKEADMVVVQGRSQKDRHGNFVMLATGVYIRK